MYYGRLMKKFMQEYIGEKYRDYSGLESAPKSIIF
jgi:hypothetical protein